MKAIILEIKNGYAAALREDGVVVKTRQPGKVGETVELSEKVVAFPARRSRLLRTAVAAVLVLSITGGTYTYTNVAAASYVTLDTEGTSVELSVNRMGRIVGVRALDEDSSELAETLRPELRRLRVEDAVDLAMERMGDAPTVVAGVTGESERRTAELQEAVERGACRRERPDMEFVAFEVSRAERREAFERDMSGGRYAFERGGGSWRGPAPDWDDTGDPDSEEADDRDDTDEADDEREDMPAFAPDGGAAQAGSGVTPPDDTAQPPRQRDSSAPRPQQSGSTPRPARVDDDDEDCSEPDDDDGRPEPDDDDRSAPPAQNTRPAEQTGGQPPQTDAQPPQNGGQPPQGNAQPPQNGGQTPQQGDAQQPPQGGDPGGTPGAPRR